MKYNLPTTIIEGKEYYLYWCYGSNLNLEQMKYRCPNSIPLETAELLTHKLLWRGNSRGFGVATVEREIGSNVPGALWAIAEEDFATLDRYEGYPRLYERKAVKVLNEYGDMVEAVTYYMHTHYKKAQPSRQYMQTIIDGYDDFGLDFDRLSRFYDKHMDELKGEKLTS